MQKQPSSPSSDEWIKKMWFMHTMEYNSAIKKEWKFAICYNMGGPGEYYTKWNKSETNALCYQLNVESGKKMNEYNKIEIDSQI